MGSGASPIPRPACPGVQSRADDPFFPAATPEGPSPVPVSPRRQEEPGELERLLELGAPGSERRGPAVAPGDVTSAV